MKFLTALQQIVLGSDPTGVQGLEYFNSTSNTKRIYNGTTWLYSNEFVQIFSVGGALTVGVTGRKQRLYNRTGSPWVIVGADLYINTAPTGASATLQVNKNGASAFTISVTTGTNTANSTPSVTVANGDYLDVDVTAVGSTVAGSDATLTLSIVS
jgi:hypothetical protein